jgi:hypothetical protein
MKRESTAMKRVTHLFAECQWEHRTWDAMRAVRLAVEKSINHLEVVEVDLGGGRSVANQRVEDWFDKVISLLLFLQSRAGQSIVPLDFLLVTRMLLLTCRKGANSRDDTVIDYVLIPLLVLFLDVRDLKKRSPG